MSLSRLFTADIVIPQVGASLFASNIGTEHFIGLSGSGAAVGNFSLQALVALFALQRFYVCSFGFIESN